MNSITEWGWSILSVLRQESNLLIGWQMRSPFLSSCRGGALTSWKCRVPVDAPPYWGTIGQGLQNNFVENNLYKISTNLLTYSLKSSFSTFYASGNIFRSREFPIIYKLIVFLGAGYFSKSQKTTTHALGMSIKLLICCLKNVIIVLFLNLWTRWRASCLVASFMWT